MRVFRQNYPWENSNDQIGHQSGDGQLITLAWTMQCTRRSYRYISGMLNGKVLYSDLLTKSATFQITWSEVMPSLRLSPGHRRLWQVETSALLSSASSELESSKSKSINAEGEVRARRFGVRARVSASFSRAATSGSVEFEARSSESEEKEENVSAQYQAYVRVRLR